MYDMPLRILSALLAAVALAGLFACSDSGRPKSGSVTEPSGSTQTGGDEETRIYPDLPDKKFDGYNFRMAHWEIDGWTIIYDLDADEETGDIINDSVYKRNLAIEEKYNVEITADYINHAELINTCVKTVRAGDLPYDVYFPRTYESTQLVQQSVLLDLHTLPYIDWDKPWWDSQSVAELSLGGMLPMVEGDITLMDKSATACIFYNKKVQTDNAVGDLYQLVYNNEWTLDKMISLGRSVTADLNGDSVLDGNDRWGVVAYDDWTYIMLHGSGGRYASKDEDDYPIIAFDNERTLTVAQKILDCMWDETFFLHTNKLKDGQTPITMMAADQMLFYVERIVVTERLRAVESDFGILPAPKFDANQKNYGHSVSIHTSGILTVPLNAVETEITGILLEALAAESKYVVIPSYYDIVLKDKYTRDAESVDMLDIILQNRVYDLGEFYQFGRFNELYLRAYPNNKRDLVSLFTQNSKKMQTEIDRLIKTIEKQKEAAA